MDRVDVTIIGAGVVGLAIAAEAAGIFEDVALLERHETFGRETSSRNSEVIHAGIYYRPGSLKAVTCAEGSRMLYEFCERRSVPHKKLGKLIVAASEAEVPKLEALLALGMENGVEGLSIIDRAEVAGMEPEVRAKAAIYSPNTGIVDSHSLMKALHAEAESKGALCSFGSGVESIEPVKGGYVLGISGQDYRFFSRIVVNSAGLGSEKVAAMAGIDTEAAGYGLIYRKGSYFSYSGRSPVGRLVYPLPEEGTKSLGVHATLDMGGRLRFGPDSEVVDAIDYAVDSGKRDGFYESASRYIRGLERESFVPDMAGVRPARKGEGFMDFVIRHEDALPGFVNLIGIESPGLTACLSIASRVRAILEATG